MASLAVDDQLSYNRNMLLSAGSQMRDNPKITIEFTDYEPLHVNTTRIRFDRAATTLGFEKRNSLSASYSQRPHADTDGSSDFSTVRAITAPHVSNRSITDSLDTTRATRGRFIPNTYNRHYSEKITPDTLIKMLTDRGFDSPRMYRFPPLPPEHVIDKHYAERRKVSFYMEKLKGHSRMDSDIANARAMAFCEEQREASHARMRTGSALFRSRHRRDVKVNLQDSERSFVGSKSICSRAETGNESVKSDGKGALLLNRINTWIEGCDQANAKGFK